MHGRTVACFLMVAPSRICAFWEGQSPSLPEVRVQADWPILARVAALLSTLLSWTPRFIPAAIRGNVSSGLVRVLRKAHTDGKPSAQHLGASCQAVHYTLSCLTEIMVYDSTHRKVFWRPAVNAGIVPVLIDLLTHRHEQTVSKTLELSGMLLTSAPEGEVGQWGLGLVHATTRVLSADRPVAVRNAAEMLHKVGSAHPCLIADCHTWRIDDSLQQLTTHSDPGTAAAALHLKKLLSSVKPEPDVSPLLNSTSILSPSLDYCLVYITWCVGSLLRPMQCPTSVP
jgi:hypothetical protein